MTRAASAVCPANINQSTAARALALPALPSGVNLSNHPFWRDRYQKLLARTDLQTEATERLIALLHENLGRIRRNRYNLEVLLAQAKFTRHNLSLLHKGNLRYAPDEK